MRLSILSGQKFGGRQRDRLFQVLEVLHRFCCTTRLARYRHAPLRIQAKASRRKGRKAGRKEQGLDRPLDVNHSVDTRGLCQWQLCEHAHDQHVGSDEPGGPQRDGKAADCDGQVRGERASALDRMLDWC